MSMPKSRVGKWFSAPAIAILVAGTGAAQAYSLNVGIDTNASGAVPLATTPLADAANTTFRSNLANTVTTETFESKVVPTPGPLVLTFGGSNGNIFGTLAGGAGFVGSAAPGTTNSGRYSVPSGSSSNYWDVSLSNISFGDATITFASDVAAFGFYGTDFGEFDGSFEMQLLGAVNNVLANITVNFAEPRFMDGSVLFLGVRAQSTGELFRSVRFIATGGDIVGMDNLVVADACQARLGACADTGNVPEPGTLALAGVALLGMVAMRRRKSS